MKLTQEEFKLVELKAQEFMVANPNWRKGQSYFNALFMVNPIIANNIRATRLDMFHRDDNIDKFKEVLEVE